MPDATPFLDPADVETCYCAAAVVGRRFVTIAGPKVDGLTQVRLAAAGEEVYGVAMRDAALGAKVGVAQVGVWPVLVGGAPLAAGARVQSGADGVAIVLAAGRPAGLVVDDVAAGAAEAPINLNRGR